MSTDRDLHPVSFDPPQFGFVRRSTVSSRHCATNHQKAISPASLTREPLIRSSYLMHQVSHDFGHCQLDPTKFLACKFCLGKHPDYWSANSLYLTHNDCPFETYRTSPNMEAIRPSSPKWRPRRSQCKSNCSDQSECFVRMHSGTTQD